MKKFFTTITRFFVLFFAAGCHTDTPSIPGNAVLLDVRTPAEFASASLPGSILIPHDRITAEITGKVPDKNQAIIVFCRSGRRSAIAAETLRNMGYTDITDLGSIENASKVLNKSVVSNR
jgi:rhodanese-related sulfurtransferase